MRESFAGPIKKAKARKLLNIDDVAKGGKIFVRHHRTAAPRGPALRCVHTKGSERQW